MKMKDYIISEINKTTTCFPKTKVSYYVDEFSDSNYIKVLPSDEYKNNDDYIRFETNFIIDFINKFPYQEIVFISEDSTIDISKPVYEVEGELYATNKLSLNSDFGQMILK